LPLSLILAVVLVSQGVVQTFDAYKTVPLLEPVTYEQPTLDPEGKPLTDTSGIP
jgi:potassium-transporting ATPase potassium-binding subunit